jgi:glutamate carboxypeptidase
MLYALKSLRDTGLLNRMSIRVILTGDEEKRGSPFHLATRALIDAGKWADIAIGFEDGDGDPTTAVVSRRGASGWELTVKGRPAHSSQIFRQGYGDGAIYEAARILNQFRETLASEPNLTFNPGVIVGGSKSALDPALSKGTAYGKNNIIAQTTRVMGDIRALTPEQLTFAQKAMAEIANNNLAETSSELKFLEGYPPMAPTKGNHMLLSLYNQISEDLGFGEVTAVDPRKAGAADISFVAAYVDMAIDGLGLMGSGGHTKEELADMHTLNQQTSRAALLLHRLAKRPSI